MRSTCQNREPVGTTLRNKSANPAFLKIALNIVTVLVLGLNAVILMLEPLWPESRPSCNTWHSDVLHDESTQLMTSSTTNQKPPPTSTHMHMSTVPQTGLEVRADHASVKAHQNLKGAFHDIPPGVIRLVPDSFGEALARAYPCWLTIGISSVHRQMGTYLGITLAQIFDATHSQDMDLNTTIVVHLADFDETRVEGAHRWLTSSFRYEIQTRRLHLIHAAQSMYGMKISISRTVSIKGFAKSLNGDYAEHQELMLSGVATYWSAAYVLYRCGVNTSSLYGRWGIVERERFSLIAGNLMCIAQARSKPYADLSGAAGSTDWDELVDDVWVQKVGSGVSAVVYQAREGYRMKFGDSPHRQWWRSKQNLDYSFLMWYSAGLSSYYLQMEDDVQVAQNFFSVIRNSIHEQVRNNPSWHMVSFSKLGFIGKLFKSFDTLDLAEFLFTFFDEAPCDWLVWVWIDLHSDEPLAPKIANDLETDLQKRNTNARNPKILANLRDDVALFYRDGGGDIFSDTLLPSRRSGQSAYLAARVRSNMKHWKDFIPERSYPPGDPVGFWTSDTCSVQAPCQADMKFLELVFDTPQILNSVHIEMGNAMHSQDFMHNGTLEVGHGQNSSGVGCQQYVSRRAISEPSVMWKETAAEPIQCLRLRMLAPQKQWLMIRFTQVYVSDPTPLLPRQLEVQHPTIQDGKGNGIDVVHGMSTSIEEASLALSARTAHELFRVSATNGQRHLAKSPEDHQINVVTCGMVHGQALVEQAVIAMFVGAASGVAGWLLVCSGRILCRPGLIMVGEFACWAMGFMLLLDVLVWRALLHRPDPPRFAGQHLGHSATSSSVILSTTSLMPTSRQEWIAQTQTTPRAELLVTSAPGRVQRETMLQQLNWKTLSLGITKVNMSSVQVLSQAELVNHRSWLTIGLLVDSSCKHVDVATTVVHFLQKGQNDVLILLHITHDNATKRSELISFLRSNLENDITAGRVLAIHAPMDLHPKQPTRQKNIDLAILLAVARMTADFFMSVEVGCKVVPGYVAKIRSYIASHQHMPWHVVSFRKAGFLYKLIRSSHLQRMSQLLVLYPNLSEDILVWSMIDLIQSKSAPKACYIAVDATRRKRPDVVLQYHKGFAIIEHVGDVSSLEGKVQRLHEEYFKKHAFANALFDDPKADVHITTITSKTFVTGVYACDGITGMGACTSFVHNAIPKPNERANVFIEVVFGQPIDVEIFLLRTGGFLQAAKNRKSPETPDQDFHFMIADGILSFGHMLAERHTASQSMGACSAYVEVGHVSGREIFWRNPLIPAAEHVRCIKVALVSINASTLIIRGLRVRSSRRREFMRSQGLPLAAKQDAQSTAQTSHPNSRSTQTPFVEASVAAYVESTPVPNKRQYQTSVATETQVQNEELDIWTEQHFSWILKVCITLGMGGSVGILGYLAMKLLPWAGRRCWT